MIIKYETEQVQVLQSALYQTNCTIVMTDDLVLIVDPTWLPLEVATIKAFVDRIKEDRPVYLVFTHSDFDHIIGYKAFMGTATTIASQAFVDNPEKETQVNDLRSFCDTYYISPLYVGGYPDIDIVIKEEGETLEIGETSLTFYFAPGHTADSMMLVVEPLGVLIVGDYLSDVEFPFIYHSSRAYERTLGMMRQLLDVHTIRLMIPGHGTYEEDVASIHHRIRESEEYITKLRTSLLGEAFFNLEAYLIPYLHRESLRAEHEKNVELLKRELSI